MRPMPRRLSTALAAPSSGALERSVRGLSISLEKYGEEGAPTAALEAGSPGAGGCDWRLKVAVGALEGDTEMHHLGPVPMVVTSDALGEFDPQTTVAPAEFSPVFKVSQ